MTNNVRKISNDQGNYLSVVGDTYRIVISGKETNGEFALIDMQVPPGHDPGTHTRPSRKRSTW